MKRLFLALAGILAGCLAFAQSVNDLDITVRIQPDGSARIVQVWDVDIVDGTEWYVPVTGLGEMMVKDFSVSENGQAFFYEGRGWDSGRTAKEKEGRCGIIEKKGHDVELCWGHGGGGSHVFKAEFTLTGLVKSMKDKDGFNFQFVNDDMSGRRHVKVTLENGTSTPWTLDNVVFWAFGYEGDINLVDGKIVAESSDFLSYDSSVIILCGFDKGIFSPVLTDDREFEEIRKDAFSGSAFENWKKGFSLFDGLDMEDIFAILAAIGVFFAMIVGAIRSVYLKATGKVYKKSVYGVDKIDGWCREVPYGGDVLAAYSTLVRGNRLTGLKGNSEEQNHLIGAYFLKWIQDGIVQVQVPDPTKKKTNLYFPEIEHDFDGTTERELYSMALAASGQNRILETKEFKNWSYNHASRVIAWPKKALSEGTSNAVSQGFEKARQVIEFKNFLNDFTISDQREAIEVKLWKDYLVFAALYGIADKVASTFQRLYPAEFTEYTRSVGMYDYSRMINTINYTGNMGSSFMSSAKSYYSSSTVSGHGGHSSFGGGGGFSGGGHGGGSR